MTGMGIKDFNMLASIKEMGHLKLVSTLDGEAVPCTGYKHHRKYDTYDTRLRRML